MAATVFIKYTYPVQGKGMRFLACMYECTGRDIILTLAWALAAASALVYVIGVGRFRILGGGAKFPAGT